MKTEDLDLAYTELCQTMTDLGEDKTPLFLARFAMLSLVEMQDLAAARQRIAAAAALLDVKAAA